MYQPKKNSIDLKKKQQKNKQTNQMGAWPATLITPWDPPRVRYIFTSNAVWSMSWPLVKGQRGVLWRHLGSRSCMKFSV